MINNLITANKDVKVPKVEINKLTLRIYTMLEPVSAELWFNISRDIDDAVAVAVPAWLVANCCWRINNSL